MGKIVKYCGSCEEGFAEKFGFCPNCGAQLQAFEMNPLGGLANGGVSEAAKTEFGSTNGGDEAKASAADVVEETPKTENQFVTEPAVFTAPDTSYETPVTEEFKTVELPKESDVSTEEPKTFAASAAAGANGASSGNGHQFAEKSEYNYSASPTAAAADIDDGFHVTVIEEKNAKQRNVLLLGSLLLMTSIAIGGTIYSLFNKSLLVGAIEQGDLIAFVPEVEPMEMEEEPQPKKDDDKGGGGGGGGKEEQTEASKGRLPPQSLNPITPPDVNIPQLTNPTLKLRQETQGTINRPVTEERTGIPSSLSAALSNGTGSGGGIGSGRGTGVGTGVGTGEGSGIGSGSGSGVGSGVGSGTGAGTGGGAPPPPPPVKPKPRVTTALQITSKPRANYTDAARQNQVQGTVTLRVTFLASGQIGSISPVSGLPYGLTEQAIAAARSMKFVPQMVDGEPKTVTKQVQYSFTIY
jgi:TonB family protein